MTIRKHLTAGLIRGKEADSARDMKSLEGRKSWRRKTRKGFKTRI